MNLRAVAERVLPEPLRGRAGPLLGRTMDRLAVPPPGLKAGAGTPRGGADRRPAVIVLLLGATGPDAVAATAAELVHHGPVAGGPRPVVVLDTPHFAAVRRAGLAADHILARAEYEARHPGQPYSAYLAQRLDQLRRDYATRHVVTVPPEGVAALGPGALAELLVVPRRGWWRRVWEPTALRFEAAIDRPTSGA